MKIPRGNQSLESSDPVTFHHQRSLGGKTTGSEDDFPSVIRNHIFDTQCVFPTRVGGFKSPPTFHFSPIQRPVEVVNAFMGQNALKSAIFSLLDFSVLEPFGDADVQFWRTKITVIQVKNAFMVDMSRVMVFLTRKRGLSARLAGHHCIPYRCL